MIRLGVITDEISQDFEHALDVMLEYGVREAELRGLWGTNVLELDEAARARARAALSERGMRVCGIASPLYKCHLDPPAGDADAGALHLAVQRTSEEQLAILERAIALTEYFDTKLIRVFSYWKAGELTDQVFARIVEGLRPAVQRAEEAGVVLGLENEHACMLGTGAEAARALNALDSHAFRSVWDPGNAFFSGERPFPDGYHAVWEHLAHVHIKDAVRGPDGAARWTVVGEGEIDFQGQLSALTADGYEGVLSLETHYKEPGGSPERSSRACLEGLQRLLREVGVPVG
jgi:sugar phosphate isomerase/epimerase